MITGVFFFFFLKCGVSGSLSLTPGGAWAVHQEVGEFCGEGTEVQLVEFNKLQQVVKFGSAVVQ